MYIMHYVPFVQHLFHTRVIGDRIGGGGADLRLSTYAHGSPIEAMDELIGGV